MIKGEIYILTGGNKMPEWVGILIFLGVTLVIWYFVWKMHQIEERRKSEKERMKQELKMQKHRPTIKANLKLEKARMKHEFKMNRHKPTLKEIRKMKKDEMNHELHMNDKENTADKAIGIIPEATKNIGDIINNLNILSKFRKK